MSPMFFDAPNPWTNKILIGFSELDFFDKDHEISQFFHFQVLDLLKDTKN